MSSNSVGAILAMYVPIALSGWLWNPTRRRFFWLGIIGLFLICIPMSASRAGLLDIAGGCVVVVILSRRLSLAKSATVVLGLLAIVALITSWLPIAARLTSFGMGDPGVQARFTLWKDVFSIAGTFAGILLGYGQFGNRLAWGPEYPPYYDHAHSFFLQALVEAGVPGLVLALAWVVLLFLRVRRGSAEFIRVGLTGALTGFMVASLFDYTVWEIKVFYAFWSVLFLAERASVFAAKRKALGSVPV
ncbi:MAG TPA: O-antigen ligase family protein [Firmicutes bacterium]|nr:O-antigen ligase family protein [Bacillota bacterium]